MSEDSVEKACREQLKSLFELAVEHAACIEGCDPCIAVDELIEFVLVQRREGAREMRERAAMLHESIVPECDHDTRSLGPWSGPGGMAILIRYRDAIRALPLEPDEPEEP